MQKLFIKCSLIAVLLSINFLVFVGEVTKLLFFFILKLIFRFFSYAFYILFYLIKSPKLLLKKTRKINIRKHFKILRIPFLPFKGFYLILTSAKTRYFLSGIIVSFIIVFSYGSYIFVKDLPSPHNIGKVNFPLSTHIVDRNGKLLYEVYRKENRTRVSLDRLPRYVVGATVAIEDKDFYRHKGVSIISGIVRAIKDTLIKKSLQGGSTITQQLVKSALLTPERTLTRKIREIILALWSEKIYSKNQILEMYLNQVPYGGASYGIEEASKTYFDKPARELQVWEAALLAGLPQAPTIYSPYVNPDLAKKRRQEVLKVMYEQKYIDKNMYEESIKKPLDITPSKIKINAPHFVFYVKQELEDKYDMSTIEEGGLRVKTTLDLDIQNMGENILKDELKNLKNLNVTNGAILVTKPATGEILAMVGSSDYFASPSGAFNIATALRQPGSSIKPIMYSLALERGFTAASIIDDTPISYNIPGSESYRPLNYDGKFHGKVPLRSALANSYNIPAVKVLDTLGVANFIQHASNLGISTYTDPSNYGLSITLGSGEVKMVDMATAFGVFANLGNRVDVQSFLRVEDTDGKIISELKQDKTRVLDEGVSFIISDILSDNAARTPMFGANSLLKIPGFHVAVKTGTTNDKKDNWTIGYTPNFLVVVWVGNNDNSPMNQYLTSGITGASPIWNKMMTYLLQNYQGGDIWLKKPVDVVEKNCSYGKKEYFVKGTENAVRCPESRLSVTPKPSISETNYYTQ